MNGIEADQAAYVGCRVRWRLGEFFLPREKCRPGAPVTYQVIQIEPEAWEISYGVRIVDGDEGVVAAYLGVDELGPVYEVEFDNGGVFPMTLPQPHAIEILGMESA